MLSYCPSTIATHVRKQLTDEEWAAGRAGLALHLERLSTHPPKRIIDIPVPFAERYFEMMPFDKQFLTPDAPTARGFLQLQLVSVSEQLSERMDAAEMAEPASGCLTAVDNWAVER